MHYLTRETMPGKTIQAGENKITPFSQAIRLTLPGVKGGLIWNRPVSVIVQGADGSEQVLPVVDITRTVQLTLLGAGLVIGLLTWLIQRR